MPRSRFELYRISFSWVYSITIIAIYLLSFSKTSEIFSTFLFSFGLFFIAVATVGRLWCSLYIAGYKNKQLVTDGPYSICRNPLYLFSLIGVIGVGLSSEMLTILILLIIPYAIYYPFVIRSEERKLLNRYGALYGEYMNNTPRFIPKWRLFREPETYQVIPEIFRKQIFDAVWFVWVAAGMELVEELHELHILPTYFHLY